MRNMGLLTSRMRRCRYPQVKLQHWFWILGIAFAAASGAQPPSPNQVQNRTDSGSTTIVVTASFEPLPLREADRSLAIIDTAAQPLLFHSPEDYLPLDPSVELNQRGPDGIQADVSIRGTTFEQSLILLNGLRINDPETGHLNLDIPVPMNAISRIEVLHGSGSTFYGSDAMGGAINLVTAKPSRDAIVIGAGGGSFGSTETELEGDHSGTRWAEKIAGVRDTSDGFMPDREYHNNAASSESWMTTPLGTTDVLLAASDRPFGANGFYGAWPSWERTKGWWGSAQQALGDRTEADFAYRRHTDLYVLEDNDPAFYENNHIDTGWQADVRRTDPLGRSTYLAYGLEEDGEGIRSNSLGRHGRNQGAGYLNVDLRTPKRFSLSVGAREEVLSGTGSVFSPSAAAGLWLSHGWRVTTAWGHGFRLPTFVDLYYSDPATQGNPSLQPESSWSGEAGLSWESARVSWRATGFGLRAKNVIDYSKYSNAAPWQANNVQQMSFSGVETALTLRLPNRQSVDLAYTGLLADQQAPAGLISEYAFNYAAQNASFAWAGELGQVEARTQVQVIQRQGSDPYPLWSVALARSRGLVRPYLRAINLSNTGYQEIAGVPMPGRWFMAGLELHWETSERPKPFSPSPDQH